MANVCRVLHIFRLLRIVYMGNFVYFDPLASRFAFFRYFGKSRIRIGVFDSGIQVFRYWIGTVRNDETLREIQAKTGLESFRVL